MPRRTPSPLLHPEGSFQIDFPDFGCLDVRIGSHEVAFLSLFGEDLLFSSHSLAENHSFLYVLTPDARAALIAASDALYFFDASAGDLRRVSTLDRWGDSGFEHIQLHDVGNHFICHFEQGLVAISYAGSELWRVSQLMWLWRFHGTRGDLLIFEDQDGEYHAFDSRSGEERAV